MQSYLHRRRSGFTLIELSIVLVIVGLLVGGVLVGRDLVNASYLRAQVSQIERYQAAVNTFRGKFGYLPGDIPAALVTQFGFTGVPVRAGTEGRGDGNGELVGQSGGTAYAWNQNGENAFFWVDLTVNSNLIEGRFNTITDGGDVYCTSSAACSAYFPSASIGGGNMLYIYSGYAAGCCSGFTKLGPNFFGLSVVKSSGTNMSDGGAPPAPGLSVSQAYNIDKKIDDGLPQSGGVLAQHLGTSGMPHWSAHASSASATTCFDTTSGQYSIMQNNGMGINCALSFEIK